MKTVDVTLRITYDETKYNIPPEKWDWDDLLDFWDDSEGEEVRVVSVKEKAK